MNPKMKNGPDFREVDAILMEHGDVLFDDGQLKGLRDLVREQLLRQGKVRKKDAGRVLPKRVWGKISYNAIKCSERTSAVFKDLLEGGLTGNLRGPLAVAIVLIDQSEGSEMSVKEVSKITGYSESTVITHVCSNYFNEFMERCALQANIVKGVVKISEISV